MFKKKEEEKLKEYQFILEQDIKRFSNELQALLAKYSLGLEAFIHELGPRSRIIIVDVLGRKISLEEWIKLRNYQEAKEAKKNE